MEIMGIMGLLVVLAWVCLGGLVLAVLITALVVLLKVNARLNRQAATAAGPGRTDGATPEAPTQNHQ